jgi:hypothetical protein
VTASTCPSGTKLVAQQKPEGRAEWCAVTESTSAVIPPTSRVFEGTLGIGQLPAMPGGVNGPYSGWYPDGTLKSHGRYVDVGARSVAEGLWAFWRADGSRWVMGLYHRGEPAGCFVEWGEDGTRRTGIVVGTEFRAAPCKPPPDDEMAVLEGHRRELASAGWADFSLTAFAGPNRLGASNGNLAIPDPDSTFALALTPRARIGRWRVGPTVGMRPGDDQTGMAYVLGAQVGWQLPSFHPRVETEVAADIAAQYIRVDAVRPRNGGIASVHFWSPLLALQARAAFVLSPTLSAILGARVEGTPARSVGRDTVYCDFACFAPVHETWDVGGLGYGVTLGLSLTLR